MTLSGISWRPFAMPLFCLVVGIALGTASTWGPIVDGPRVRDACVDQFDHLERHVDECARRLDELEAERFDCARVVRAVCGGVW